MALGHFRTFCRIEEWAEFVAGGRTATGSVGSGAFLPARTTKIVDAGNMFRRTSRLRGFLPRKSWMGDRRRDPGGRGVSVAPPRSCPEWFGYLPPIGASTSVAPGEHWRVAMPATIRPALCIRRLAGIEHHTSPDASPIFLRPTPRGVCRCTPHASGGAHPSAIPLVPPDNWNTPRTPANGSIDS